MRAQMLPLRGVRALIAAAVVLATIAAVMIGSNTDSTAGTAPSSALLKARALAEKPAERSPRTLLTGDAQAPPTYAPESAGAAAKRIAEAEIPLPPGLDSAGGLVWERQGMGGPVPETLIRDLLESNAARDWIWYAATHDLTTDQREIVSLLLRWPGVRPATRWLQPKIEAVLDGKDRASARAEAARLFPDHGGAARAVGTPIPAEKYQERR